MALQVCYCLFFTFDFSLNFEGVEASVSADENTVLWLPERADSLIEWEIKARGSQTTN